MKKTIYLTLLASIVSLSACDSSPKKGITQADTSIVVALYRNPYAKVFNMDSAFRIVKDSTKIDGDKVVHYADTMYYISVSYPLQDPKDSTHKTNLKNKQGTDSLVITFQPLPPSMIVQDFSLPYTPKQKLTYHSRP